MKLDLDPFPHRLAFVRAHATLRAGCAFMIRHAGDRAGAEHGLPAFAYSRLVGNRLRELDRFLSVLIEEGCRCLGDARHDARAFARLRNTPYKLRLLEAMLGRPSGDEARLRAIGRVGACLCHCAGTIRRPGLGEDVRLAGGAVGADAIPAEACARLDLPPRAIRSISDFYRTIGDRLLVAALRRPPRLDFPAPEAHLTRANVACDGI